MDETDAKIISMLLQKGNSTNTEMARQLGITEAAVRKRIDKLLAEGAIKKFTIELGSLGVSALVLVCAEPHAPVDKVAAKISKLPNVISVHELSGNYDLAVVLSAPSSNEINSTVDAMRTLQYVATTDTRIILRKWP